ncbi:hypothetical protein [Mariniradius saccharolyticus]|uniref:hypothetical protein n=1 Tax=Mariniradius saccharolyticus TaxID=1245591 RepID=UPI0012F64A30|nr:hypothetical protein [Mariniradius saccharolyticus]
MGIGLKLTGAKLDEISGTGRGQGRNVGTQLGDVPSTKYKVLGKAPHCGRFTAGMVFDPTPWSVSSQTIPAYYPQFPNAC